MKAIGIAFFVGAIAGVPLTAWLGPVGTLIAIFLVSFIISASTTDSPGKTKQQPKSAKLSKEDEELVTTILPVINIKK